MTPTPPLTPKRPFLRRILHNTAMTVASNGWTVLATTVSLPFVVRGLGPRGYAWWVLLQILSASTGVVGVLDAGLATAVTWAVATKASNENRADVGGALGTSLALFGVFAVGGTAAVALVAPAVVVHLGRVPASARHDVHKAVLLLAVQVFAELAMQGCESCLEGLQRIDLSRSVDMVRRGAIAFGTAWAATATRRLAAVEGSVAGATGLALLLCSLALWRESRGSPLRLSRRELDGVVAYARQIVLLRPISAVFRLSDRIIVAAALGPSALPFVDIANQIESGASVVLSSVSYALIPGAAWLQARDDHETLGAAVEAGTRFSLLVTWCLAAGVGLLAVPGLRVWLGARYTGVAGPVRVAMAGVALAAVAQAAGNVLYGMGKAGLILRASLVGVAVDVGLSVVLVGPLGIAGVFWGTFGGSLVTVPWIFGATARLVSREPIRLIVECATATVMPLVLEAAGVGVAFAVFDGPLAQLGSGVVLGTLGAVVGIARWGCRPGEVRQLWQAARRAPASAHTP